MGATGAMGAESPKVNPRIKGISVFVAVESVPNFPAKLDPGKGFQAVFLGPFLVGREEGPGLHFKPRPQGAFFGNELTNKVFFFLKGLRCGFDGLRWVQSDFLPSQAPPDQPSQDSGSFGLQFF